MTVFQKRVFFAVFILIIFVKAVFSETSDSQNLSFSPYIDSRFGLLLYTEESSSWYRTGKAGINLQTQTEQLTIEGQYLKGKSRHENFFTDIDFGSIHFEYFQNPFRIKSTFSSFSIPDDLKIGDGKPSFKVSVGSGNSLNFGIDFDFSLFNKDWEFGVDCLSLTAGFQEGDLYYFYGKPDDFSFLGGKSKLSLPFGLDFFSIDGKLSGNMKTNSEEKIGDFDTSLLSFFLAKEFVFQIGDKFSTKPFIGYANLSFSGNVMVTSENQRYFLFPYKFIGGSIDETFHLLSAGNSFEFKKHGFSLLIDCVYFYCLQNSASGEYSYKYKKNILFDGSSAREKIDLPNAAGTHIFAGNIDISYKFSIDKHFSPTLRISKIIATAILNEETEDFFSTSSASDTSISGASTEGNNNFTWNKLKEALLSGTSISLRIDF